MTGRAIRHALERHKLTQSRQESERRFSVAFHASPVAQSISRLATGQLVDVNEALCRMIGYSRDELIGNIPKALNIGPSAETLQALAQKLMTGEQIRETEINYRLRSGEARTLLSSFEIIQVDGMACILSSNMDITTRKTAELALRASEENYRRLTEELEQRIQKRTAEVQDLYDNAPNGYHSLAWRAGSSC
jgi:PAS domain S-box-containing protein